MRKLLLLAALAARRDRRFGAAPGPRARAAPLQPRRSRWASTRLRADFARPVRQRRPSISAATAPASRRRRQATLAAQAAWLRQHPEVVVRIEGHGDPSDTRDHALAVGARRAEEVRDYLVLLGVPAAQLTTPAGARSAPSGVGAALALNRRAVTVLMR